MTTQMSEIMVAATLITMLTIAAITVIYTAIAADDRRHQREQENLRQIFRSELNKTFVVLPDGPKIYLQTEGTKR